MVEALLRIGLLAAIFASVFVVAQITLNVMWSRRSHVSEVNKRMRMLRQGISREHVMAELRRNDPQLNTSLPAIVARPLLAFHRTVQGSGIAIAPVTILFMMGTAFAIVMALILGGAVALGISMASGVLVLALGISFCLSILIPVFVLSAMAQRQRKRIEQQFPVALDIFVRALRAGHPVASAIELLTKEMEDPIGSEFGLVSDEISYGAELTDSLAGMAERWDSDDMRMFVVSLSVQNETGGNLAEILQNLSEVIRARASLYMKVRALSSEGRMTGWMLTILPVVAFVGLFLVNPEFYLSVAEDTAFIIGAFVLATMYLMGFLIIRKLVDIKV